LELDGLEDIVVNVQTAKKNAWVACEKGKVCGIHYDGGYAEYTVAPQDAVVHLPSNANFNEVAPLLCAGITTYNALRNSGAQSGELCVVQGVGGLGHLAIQFANRMGFKTVAVSQGTDKKELALKLGAHHYIDSNTDFVKEINSLGGARIIVATAPSSKAIEAIIPALGLDGVLLLVAAAHEPIAVNGLHLLNKRASVKGWASGDSRDCEETCKFADTFHVKAMIETFPLDKANEAYKIMLANKARFRVVLTLK